MWTVWVQWNCNWCSARSAAGRTSQDFPPEAQGKHGRHHRLVCCYYLLSSLQFPWGAISPTVNCSAEGPSDAGQSGGGAILLEIHPGLPASTEDCKHWDHWGHSNTAPRVRSLIPHSYLNLLFLAISQTLFLLLLLLPQASLIQAACQSPSGVPPTDSLSLHIRAH